MGLDLQELEHRFLELMTRIFASMLMNPETFGEVVLFIVFGVQY